MIIIIMVTIMIIICSYRATTKPGVPVVEKLQTMSLSLGGDMNDNPVGQWILSMNKEPTVLFYRSFIHLHVVIHINNRIFILRLEILKHIIDFC